MLRSVAISDGCLKGAFRSAIKVAICPVYGIKQRAFLPLLQHIVGPALVGLALDVYLVIAEVSPRPLIANDRAEPFERAVIWPINDAVVMKTMIGTDFQNRSEKEALAMLFCTAAQYSGFQPDAKEPKIFCSNYRIRYPRPGSLFQCERDRRWVLEWNRINQLLKLVAADGLIAGHRYLIGGQRLALRSRHSVRSRK